MPQTTFYPNDACLEWPQECLDLAGSFADFPLKPEGLDAQAKQESPICPNCSE